ncbi:hypothetical protein [Tsukamurella ocularis]|uniref:hypothetical protein n=1 Tax=Tsukamurella ocularis TaxID=1970234 RepID=UPI0021697299|nr:hypothetical protein [Tsukamurella ocularis]MCS3780639.1 hypothetical protein [Tsukamurella ocularis]MCS3786463.1 hypothetical protein [Tsukamurella ocularis]MCS3850305.1 hypothetical protein [Tsukamurella ocularis]
MAIMHASIIFLLIAAVVLASIIAAVVLIVRAVTRSKQPPPPPPYSPGPYGQQGPGLPGPALHQQRPPHDGL